jgi:ribonuclease P protein component
VKKTVSLKQNHLFRRLYNKGQSAVSPYMAVYIRRTGRPENRLGLTVSTKLGHAVVRNRVRRRLREIYRLHETELCTGVDMVVVARVRAAHASYQQLDASFVKLCTKLGVMKRRN